MCARLAHLGTAAQQGERAGDQRRFDGDQDQADRHGQQQGPQHRGAQAAAVAGTVRLGHETGGGHAQEAERPVHRIEEQPGQGDPAQGRGRREMAGDGGIDERQQGLGEIGGNDGHRQGENPPVPGPIGQMLENGPLRPS